jgi:uncharacterized protein
MRKMFCPEDPDEIYRLAVRTAKGHGVPKDARKAFFLYEKAASLGHSESCVNLGGKHERGEGTSVDLDLAMHWYGEAASRGDPLGEYNWGRLLWHRGDIDRAVSLWELAATKGCVPAVVELAICKEEGRGVARSVEEAVGIYEDHAEECPRAALRLGLCYLKGVGRNRDEEEGERLLRECVESGDPAAMFELGTLLEDRRHVEQAYELFERAADAGLPEACEYLGEAVAMGLRGERDPASGRRYLERAANFGFVRAKYLLAVLLATGEGGSRDAKTAFLLCSEAAAAGESAAQYMLGLMLERGDGTATNTEQALHWFGVARDNGEQRAAAALRRLKTLEP